MIMTRSRFSFAPITLTLALCALSLTATSFGQATNTNRTARGMGGPRVVSPEVASDRKVTFRILAPKAETVRLAAGDIQGLAQGGVELKKGTNGVWEVTIGPVDAGAYRYNFSVDVWP